jgi:hypothetical protein
MKHLSESEIVDLIDGTLAPGRLAHLDACDACRAAADGFRDVLARAADVTIPEPSPLFWEHFSARVQQDVRNTEAVESSGWLGWADGPTVKWAMAGALLTVLLVSGVWVSLWRTSATLSRRVPATTTAATSVGANAAASVGANAAAFMENRGEPAMDDFSPDPDTDEAWALVRTVADDLPWDDATEDGLGVRPDAAERALATLTGDERSELARLLEAATKQPGA